MSAKDFQTQAKLGEGAYSVVFKVRRLADGQIYALKKVKLGNLQPKQQQNALNEVRILASIRSPYIVGYKQAFIQNGNLCIVMDYSDDGDLYQKIVEHQKAGTAFTEQDIWRTLIMVLAGLRTLHTMNILHRDLKSANVFLSVGGVARLGDMNVSKLASQGVLYTQTGTPYYASPQVWKDKPYDNKSDIWSLGCVIYEMAALKPPFRAEDMDGLYKKVIKGAYSKISDHFSKHLSTVIKSMLQVNPSNRPSAAQLLQKLEEKIQELEIKVEANTNMELLKTIRINKNLHYLTDRLPKSNYSAEPDRKHLQNNKTKQSISINNDAKSINLPKLDKIITKNIKKTQEKSKQRSHKRHTELDSLESILKIQGRSQEHRRIMYDESYEQDKKNAEKNIKAELRKIYNIKRPSPKKHLRRQVQLSKIE